MKDILTLVLIVGLIGLGIYLVKPNLYKQIAGFANPDTDPTYAMGVSGPPGASGASSMGQSPIAPNLPDNAMPPVVNLEHYGGTDQQTNAPNIPLHPTVTVPTQTKTPSRHGSSDLLPHDPDAAWAAQNPSGVGIAAGKNYLNAGALIGVDTVGQRSSASIDLRSEPANPQVAVSPWFSTAVHPSSHVIFP